MQIIQNTEVYIKEQFKMNKDHFYQSISEQTSVGYSYSKVIYDTNNIAVDYEFIGMNNAYESMLGIKEEDWIGKRISELYQLINKEPISWDKYQHSIFLKQVGKDLDMKFKYLDQYFRVKVHSPKNNYIIISLTDISVEVRESEKLLTLLDSVPIQIWYLKDSKTYLSANKEHSKFIGFKSEDLINKKLNDILGDENAAFCIKNNEIVFREKKQVVSQEWVNNSQGDQRLLSITRSPKLNRQEEISFVVCSAEDITEDYRNKQKKELQERILRSSVNFTQELLTNKNLEEALANGIDMLGKATKVDRVYYWENHYQEESKQMVTSSKLEWYLDDNERVIGDPQFQDRHIGEFTDFIGVLSQNQPINIHTKDLDETSFTKKFLESQRIHSVLTLPIFLKNDFVGLIGFDSYNQEREWTEMEISLLNSFVLLYEKALERNLLEQENKQKSDNFFNFFNMIEDLLVVLDYEGTIIDLSNNVLDRLNYTREELLGESYLKLHPKDEVDITIDKFNELIMNEGRSFNLNLATKGGEKFPIETTNSRGIWNGKPVIFAVGKDITELAMSEDKFSKAFNNSGVSMFISRFEDGTVLEVNDNFIEFFGYDRDEIIGKTTLDLLMTTDYEDRDAFKEMIRVNRKINDLEIKYIDKDQQIRTGLTNIVPVTINNEECLLTSIIDISDRVKNEKEIIELSTRDHLTDVYNRRFIYEVLEEIIEDSKREKAIFSVAIIDIDNFKSINDQYGHQVGDDILVKFTKIIKNSLRSHDILGRYGGEEFILIINHAGIEKGTKVLERVLDNVRNTFFTHNEEQIEITFSAGITSCKELEKNELTIDNLVEISDKRMYCAKKEGKNKIINKG